MTSFACRAIVALAAWFSLILPAVAQYPWSNRDITESVIYSFGRHVFIENEGSDDDGDIGASPPIATENPELTPLFALDRNAIDAISTTGSGYRLSDGD